MKKILFLITKSNWGGAQRYVYDLATALPKNGYGVSVAAGGQGALKTKLRVSGIDVLDIPALERNLSLHKELLSFWQIAKLIRKEGPDVLHVNSSKAGALGTLIGRVLGVPMVVFTSHGWAFNEDRPGWQKLAIKLIHYLTVLFSHKTIVVSHELKRQMNWPGVQGKMFVVHNGRSITDLHSRESARKYLLQNYPELQPYANDFWSVTIGELHPTKQHDVTIKAMSEVVKEVPTARQLIISDGQQEAKLRSLVKELHLQDNVFLLGHIDEAARFLKAFDLFILSSRSEALAYVIVEACIAGLPIIASNVGGIPEVVENNKSAFLIPSGDKMAIKKAYLALFNDKEKRQRLSVEATKRAEKFEFPKILRETMAIYGT